MLSDVQLADLIALVRRRYPDWESFAHPQFVEDEIVYKQAAVVKAQELLNQAELDRLIAAGDFDTFLERLNHVAQATNLLWRRVPSQGDTAVLLHPDLDAPGFCTQMRNLLYGDLPTPQRLHHFSAYLTARDLPNKWPFPTYFLFLCHPEREMFVRPQPARWFLQYVGAAETAVDSPPDADTYANLRQEAAALRQALASRGAQDMVDVQSFIWVCHRESASRTGRLNLKGQVELDMPAAEAAPNAEVEPAAPALSYEIATPDGVLKEAPVQPYTLEDAAAATGYEEETLQRWIAAIERKGQAVFYGPPGTGKTFLAQQLARHLVGGGDGFWELVQFHPAYAYEDFMQGIRPLTEGGSVRYEMVPGRFMDFCTRARRRRDVCVFIIDEINRANIAGVFGELMYLLEYRAAEVPLAGGGVFAIPDNVRLIGTMNTADRSIALVDHALRRRFAFIHLPPSEAVLRRYHAATGFPVEKLIAVLRRLNNQIGDPHYHVGHSFFLRPDLATHLPDIWRMEIELYLEEYFFDQPQRVDAFRWAQVGPELGLS